MKITRPLAMEITRSDVARLARLGGQSEENLRQLFEWVQSTETLIVQLWAAALLAVIGALLASLYSFVSGGGTGQSWWMLVVFAVAICVIAGVVLWRWKFLVNGVKEAFLKGLKWFNEERSVLSPAPPGEEERKEK